MILLADDDTDDCLLFKDALNELPVHTQLTTVYNGEQLMQLLSKDDQTHNLLFLDLNMPRMGGLEFLEELRGDPELRRVLVFVMTTSAAPEDRARAYDLNIAGYMLKHRPGQSFLKAIGMLQHFWRVIEFPE